MADLQKFFQTLESVLKHHVASTCTEAVGGEMENECLKLESQTLTCSAVLSLLCVWGKLSLDKTLLDGLRELAIKHNIQVLRGR